MTMVSSGQIQLGGSNASGGENRSVALELGVGASAQADINASAYRTLAAKSSGQIKLSDFYGKSRYTDVSVTIGYFQGTEIETELTWYTNFFGYNSSGQGLVVPTTTYHEDTVSAIGSRSPTSVFGYTINDLYTMQSDLYVSLIVVRLSGSIAQSGFYSIYNSEIGTKLTSAASYRNAGSFTEWSWTTTPTWDGTPSSQTVRFYKTA